MSFTNKQHMFLISNSTAICALIVTIVLPNPFTVGFLIGTTIIACCSSISILVSKD